MTTWNQATTASAPHNLTVAMQPLQLYTSYLLYKSTSNIWKHSIYIDMLLHIDYNTYMRWQLNINILSVGL